jgi:hypothetical protein
MEAFTPKDVFIIDETELFFRMLPDRSLSTVEYTKGTQKAKDRITVALCCNSDGSGDDWLWLEVRSESPHSINSALSDLEYYSLSAKLYVFGFSFWN